MQSVVILVGTSHPGNVGAAARGAANFGVEALRFVTPRCDVKSPEAMGRAKHARHLLEKATIHDDLANALAGTSLGVGTTARITTADNRFLRKPLDIRDWATSITDLDARIALVFGPEDTGLLSEHVNLLDQLVTVPTADYASLNLAHAVSIVCYEVHRLRQESITTRRHLEPDTLAAMNRAWDELTLCVEPRKWRRDTAQGIFRKIVGRSNPDDHEVHNIMGVLTNALRRFDHPDYRSKKSTKVLGEHGMLTRSAEEE